MITHLGIRPGFGVFDKVAAGVLVDQPVGVLQCIDARLKRPAAVILREVVQIQLKSLDLFTPYQAVLTELISRHAVGDCKRELNIFRRRGQLCVRRHHVNDRSRRNRRGSSHLAKLDRSHLGMKELVRRLAANGVRKS